MLDKFVIWLAKLDPNFDVKFEEYKQIMNLKAYFYYLEHKEYFDRIAKNVK